MKKLFFALVVIVMTTPAFAANKDPVQLRWTSNGLKVSSPAYRYHTRQVSSEFRNYETMPRREIRKSFRTLDRSINKELKKLFR